MGRVETITIIISIMTSALIKMFFFYKCALGNHIILIASTKDSLKGCSISKDHKSKDITTVIERLFHGTFGLCKLNANQTQRISLIAIQTSTICAAKSQTDVTCTY